MAILKYQFLGPGLSRSQHFLARRKAFAALVALCLLLLLVSLQSDLRLKIHDLRPTSNPTVEPSYIDPTTGLLAQSHPVSLTLNDLEAGRWVRKAELPDLSRAWRGAYAHVEGLPPPMDGETIAHTPEEVDRANRGRASEVAAWEWVGKGAIEEIPEWEDIAVRSLRSTGGIMLIGDSLQGQFFKHLRDAVFPAAMLYHVTHTDFIIRGTTHRVPAYETLSLAQSSPLAQELAHRAGAPLERLTRPIITFVRDDLLLNEEETVELVAEVLRRTPGALGRTTNLVYGNWTQSVERAMYPIRYASGNEWEGDLPTVLWMNTGGHWSPRSFLDFDEDRMLEAYRKGFISIMAAVRTFTRALPIYRPSIPGHAHCTAFRTPVASESELRRLVYTENFGWNLFTIYNDILVAELLRGEHASLGSVASTDSNHNHQEWETIDEMSLENDVPHPSTVVPEGRPSLNGPRPKGYLPVFQRSLLRPDAHRIVLDAFGNPDCLHIAGPSVLEEWLKWAWKELIDLEKAR